MSPILPLGKLVTIISRILCVALHRGGKGAYLDRKGGIKPLVGQKLSLQV